MWCRSLLIHPVPTKNPQTLNPCRASGPNTPQEAVNWQPGQQVAISTTIWRDAQNNQNEVRTIQSVSADGKTLTLTAGTQFYHYGWVDGRTAQGRRY